MTQYVRIEIHGSYKGVVLREMGATFVTLAGQSVGILGIFRGALLDVFATPDRQLGKDTSNRIYIRVVERGIEAYVRRSRDVAVKMSLLIQSWPAFVIHTRTGTCAARVPRRC